MQDERRCWLLETWIDKYLSGKMSVLVGAKQGISDSRESLDFAHLQPLFKGVVELDLTAAACDEDTSSPV